MELKNLFFKTKKLNAPRRILFNGRKGMFFTLLAIAALSLFVVTFVIVYKSTNSSSEQKRVSTLESLVLSTEKNLPRFVRISAYRIIFLIDKHIAENGTYENNVNGVFSEAFFNGTLHGAPQDLMLGATFGDIQSLLQNDASKLNANISLTNPTISINQSDPWNVKIVLKADFLFYDLNGLVSWNKTETVVSYLSIGNFNDPMYLVNTNSLISNKMTQTPYASFVSGNNISNLTNHALNSYYAASTLAPSFLSRLQGVNSADVNGVESLVNVQKLSSQGLTVYDKSVVDYIYFSNNNPQSCNVVPAGMPSWFKLDNSTHLQKYNVSCG